MNPKKQPFISIITACRNQDKYLKLTIENLLKVNSKEIEHIVVVAKDSSDNSLEIAKQYAPHITLLQDDGSKGPEGALNLAIDHVQGDVMAILGAGDIYMDKTLEKVSTLFKTTPSLKILNGNTAIYSEQPYEQILQIPMFPVKWEHIVYGGMIISTEATFWKTSLFKEKGNRFNYNRASDFELWTRLFHNLSPQEVAYTSDILSTFTLHAGQRSGIVSRQFRDMVEIRDKLLKNSNMSQEQVAQKIVFWTKQVCDEVTKRNKELKQPYTYLPDTTVWFSGWPFENVSIDKNDLQLPDLLKEQLNNLVPDIKSSNYKRIAIYGIGKHTQRLLSYHPFENTDLSLCGFISDSLTEQQDFPYNNTLLPVCNLKDYASLNADALLLSSDVYEERMFNNAIAANIPEHCIYRIYNNKLDWRIH